MSTFATNKQARFNYELLETYEAGLVLLGHEVKSIKTGHASLKGSFITISQGEFFLSNSLVPLYAHASRHTVYEPNRPRKLLLKKSEIKTLIGKKGSEGLTLVPLKLYEKGRHIKVSFALARGKKKHDKRSSIKKRDSDRKISRALKV